MILAKAVYSRKNKLRNCQIILLIIKKEIEK